MGEFCLVVRKLEATQEALETTREKQIKFFTTNLLLVMQASWFNNNELNNPWIQQNFDSTILNSATLDSTTLGLNDIEFNNPWIQQTQVQQSLDSTSHGFKNP